LIGVAVYVVPVFVSSSFPDGFAAEKGLAGSRGDKKCSTTCETSCDLEQIFPDPKMQSD
jgi:hypothetical protein